MLPRRRARQIDEEFGFEIGTQSLAYGATTPGPLAAASAG